MASTLIRVKVKVDEKSAFHSWLDEDCDGDPAWEKPFTAEMNRVLPEIKNPTKIVTNVEYISGESKLWVFSVYYVWFRLADDNMIVTAMLKSDGWDFFPGDTHATARGP